LHILPLDSEDEGDIFFRNVELFPKYTALQSTRPY
jgi:hypothetical protein